MERTGSQKLLRGLSILNIATATPVALLAGAMVVGGNALATKMAAADMQLERVMGISASPEQAGGLAFFVGFGLLLGCIFALIASVFGMRAADNLDEIKPAWMLAGFGLVGTIAMGIASATHGGMTIGLSFFVVLAALYFWSTNNVMIDQAK